MLSPERKRELEREGPVLVAIVRAKAQQERLTVPGERRRALGREHDGGLGVDAHRYHAAAVVVDQVLAPGVVTSVGRQE